MSKRIGGTPKLFYLSQRAITAAMDWFAAQRTTARPRVKQLYPLIVHNCPLSQMLKATTGVQYAVGPQEAYPSEYVGKAGDGPIFVLGAAATRVVRLYADEWSTLKPQHVRLYEQPR